LIISALAFTVTTGCKKSNNGGSSNSVSATIGGTAFTPTTTTAWYSKDTAVYEIACYTVKPGDTSVFALAVQPPFTINKLITDQNTVGLDYYHNSKDYLGGGGAGHVNLTVTSLDSVNHKIAGNFTGTLYNVNNPNDSLLVTNGTFNTSYIIQP
jgi:hypothetical protein